MYTFWSGVGAVLAYFYSLYLGGHLAVPDFGKYNSLNAIIANGTSFYSPLSIFICREIASEGGSVHRVLDNLKRYFLFGIGISICIFVVLLFLSMRAGNDNSIINSCFDLLIVSAGIFLGAISVQASSALQGTGKMVLYGFLGFVMVVLRFAFSVFLIPHATAYAPLISMSTSYMVLTIILVIVLWGRSEKEAVSCKE